MRVKRTIWADFGLSIGAVIDALTYIIPDKSDNASALYYTMYQSMVHTNFQKISNSDPELVALFWPKNARFQEAGMIGEINLGRKIDSNEYEWLLTDDGRISSNYNPRP